MADETSSDGGASSVADRDARPTREGKALSVTSREIRWGATTPRGGGEGETGVADRRAERVVSAGRVGWNPLRAHPGSRGYRRGRARDAAIYNHAETRAFLGTSWGIRARSTHYWD